MTNSAAEPSSAATLNLVRQPSYWGLTEQSKFEVTRSRGDVTLKGNAPVPIADALEFLEKGCGIDLAAQEILVAAIFHGVPFEIDESTVVFRLMADA